MSKSLLAPVIIASQEIDTGIVRDGRIPYPISTWTPPYERV